MRELLDNINRKVGEIDANVKVLLAQDRDADDRMDKQDTRIEKLESRVNYYSGGLGLVALIGGWFANRFWSGGS